MLKVLSNLIKIGTMIAYFLGYYITIILMSDYLSIILNEPKLYLIGIREQIFL